MRNLLKEKHSLQTIFLCGFNLPISNYVGNYVYYLTYIGSDLM